MTVKSMTRVHEQEEGLQAFRRGLGDSWWHGMAPLPKQVRNAHVAAAIQHNLLCKLTAKLQVLLVWAWLAASQG